MPDEETCGTLLSNLLDLSADLKQLLRESVMCDISLCVNGKDIIYCHKELLSFRSKWFNLQNRLAESNGATQIALSENMQVLEAVLFYIYTGNLQLIESLDVSLLDMYQAAKKYGLLTLEKLLAGLVREKKVKELTQTIDYLWTVKVEDYNSLSAECPALDGFSLCGTDKWKMKIKPMGRSDESEPRNGVYIVRQTGESRKTSHVVNIMIYVLDRNGIPRSIFSNQHTYIEDGEYLLTNFLTHAEVQKAADTLIPDGVLTLSCQLSICAKVGYFEKFRLEGPYRKGISSELHELSYTMYKMHRFGHTHDLKIEFPTYSVRIHSYLLFVRSRIPKNFIKNMGILGGLGNIGWTSFVNFLYSGQPQFLSDHGRAVYSGLYLTQFTEAKQKYSNYLSKNLDLDNAFHLLCDAAKYKDDYLLTAAADFLACKSNTLTDPQVWIQIAKDKINSIKLSFP